MARERSPNHPAIDLDKALSAASDLYTKEGRSDIPIEVAAKAWGYAGLSGPARSKIAALRQYGLATQVKGNLQVTDLALTLILRTEDTAERRQTLKKAALSPALFGELRDTHPDASEDGLRHHLVVDKRFTEDGANRFIRAYQATMEFANLVGMSYNSGEDDTGNEDEPKLPSQTTSKYTLPISSDQSIMLWGNFPITPAEWEQMNRMIEAMRPALVRDEG